MKTIDVLPVGTKSVLVKQLPAVLGVSLRTTSRYISWAIASELSPFADYQKGNPVNLLQQKALTVIREGRKRGLPGYRIAELVEAITLPPVIPIDQFAQWIRARVPPQYAEDFVNQLYKDFDHEIAKASE